MTWTEVCSTLSQHLYVHLDCASFFLCELLPSDLLINPKGHLKHPKQATREKLDYKLFRAPSCIENPPGHWTRKSSAVGVVGRVKPPGPGRAPRKIHMMGQFLTTQIES